MQHHVTNTLTFLSGCLAIATGKIVQLFGFFLAIPWLGEVVTILGGLAALIGAGKAAHEWIMGAREHRARMNILTGKETHGD